MTPSYTTYATRLGQELEDVRVGFLALLDCSTIINVDPNRRGSGIIFIGAAKWGWAPSDGALTVARMDLLDQYQRWYERYRLLFRTPTPDVRKKLERSDKFVRDWLDRPGRDHSIPSSIEVAKKLALKHLLVFEEHLMLMASRGDGRYRLVPDTNALIDNPDLESYAAAVGVDHAVIHLLPSVLGELDDLKASARTPDLRESVRSAIRRIKGLRDRGRLTDGVTVAGRITARAETVEVDPSTVLGWLDPTVMDDRIIGASLRLQSDYPADSVILITSDLNLQNKSEAAGLPYVEPRSR